MPRPYSVSCCRPARSVVKPAYRWYPTWTASAPRLRASPHQPRARRGAPAVSDTPEEPGEGLALGVEQVVETEDDQRDTVDAVQRRAAQIDREPCPEVGARDAANREREHK